VHEIGEFVFAVQFAFGEAPAMEFGQRGLKLLLG
jgi:hypothetical protein